MKFHMLMWTQKPPLATAYRFESGHRHQSPKPVVINGFWAFFFSNGNCQSATVNPHFHQFFHQFLFALLFVSCIISFYQLLTKAHGGTLPRNWPNRNG